MDVSRRKYLTGLGITVAVGVSGCLGPDDDDNSGEVNDPDVSDPDETDDGTDEGTDTEDGNGEDVENSDYAPEVDTSKSRTEYEITQKPEWTKTQQYSEKTWTNDFGKNAADAEGQVLYVQSTVRGGGEITVEEIEFVREDTGDVLDLTIGVDEDPLPEPEEPEPVEPGEEERTEEPEEPEEPDQVYIDAALGFYHHLPPYVQLRIKDYRGETRQHILRVLRTV